MFKGWLLGVRYYSWVNFKEAYNKAVLDEKLFDKDGRKITKLLGRG